MKTGATKTTMKTEAYAKVNLTLEVFGVRGDGYHALRSIVAPISLSDTLEIDLSDGLSSDTGYPDDLIPVKTTLGFSFPSGHTSLTFSVATSLSLSCPKWYVIAPSMLWASSVAFSRLYLGVHYPSDVLTGMVVGVASGIFSHWLSKRLYEDSDLPAPKLVTMPIVIKF